jgi:DNA polymerase III epsilon subunit family exonuclease
MPNPTVETHLQTHSDTVVILDLETTGLDHRTERIIEIGAVKLYRDEIIDTYTTLVKPDVPIRQSSYHVHHISEEMVAEAPTMEEVLPVIMEFMGDAPMVAHNAIFDYSFLNEASKRIRGERIGIHRIDTYDMFRIVFPEEISHGLSALLARFGFESDVSHRALDDAQNLAKVYPLLRDLYSQQKSWQLSQLENINYLVERYTRLQRAMQLMQSELADMKEIFKLYFQEGGKPVKLSNGDLMVSGYRRTYEYNDATVRKIIDSAGMQDAAYKVNPRYLDKVIDRKLYDADVVEALKDARMRMNESRQVNFVKPVEKEATLETAAANEEETSSEPDVVN